jgi:hypothetical protein
MTLKEYSNMIAKLAKKCPEAKVIYASDEEGNSFDEIYFSPRLGIFRNGEFQVDDESKPNACCVN